MQIKQDESQLGSAWTRAALALIEAAARAVAGKVIVMRGTGWQIDVEFDEDDTHTHATATAQGRGEPAMTGRGDAYRNPNDSNQPVVGEEIAAARALIDLGTQFLQAAAAQIEQVTHQPTHLSR